MPFNIPYLTGYEKKYITDALNNIGRSSDKSYAERCINLIKDNYIYRNLYLTSSCTAALEVSALLLDIKQGDEIIVPSYTFPSTANAFLRQGAAIVVADSRDDHPGLDESVIESLITNKTRAIVAVHYAGVACDMDKIMEIAENHGLLVIEDAALAFGSNYKSKPLGGIGHLGCLSFHQSKNLQCIEGGALIINDTRFRDRAISILDKGTNRNEFISGKVKRYEWVDVGSAYRMTEIHSAFLYAQLEKAEWIKEKRLSLWNLYFNAFKVLEEKDLLRLPLIPGYAGHNAHTFYLVLNNQKMMAELMSLLEVNDIEATVHYTSLDQSIFWRKNHTTNRNNINSLSYNDCLLRLPLFNSMKEDEVEYVVTNVLKFFNS